MIWIQRLINPMVELTDFMMQHFLQCIILNMLFVLVLIQKQMCFIKKIQFVNKGIKYDNPVYFRIWIQRLINPMVELTDFMMQHFLQCVILNMLFVLVLIQKHTCFIKKIQFVNKGIKYNKLTQYILG